MAKKNSFSLRDLTSKGMIEVSPGVFQKASKPQPRDKKKYIEEIVFNGKRIHLADAIELDEFEKIDFGFNILKQTEFNRLEIKPLSVNGAWAGKRFKTPQYKAYEQSAISMLPNLAMPKPPYKLTLIFAFSNKASDIDNPAKLFIDILQKRYKFNDKDIYELIIKKVIVPKRHEHLQFKIEHLL